MSPRSFSAVGLCALTTVFIAGDTLDNRLHHVEKAGAPHAVYRRSHRTACEDYDERLDVLYCDANYIQAFRDATEKSCCTNLYFQYSVYDAFYACGSNQNGTVCAVFEEDLEDDYTDDILLLCSSSVGVECEAACQQTLSQLAEKAGCCIHTFESELIKRQSLWTNCGIEQPLPCDNTPPPLDKPAYSNLCSLDYSEKEVTYTFCSTVGEKLEQLNTECGVPEETYERCGHHNGELCDIMDYPY